MQPSPGTGVAESTFNLPTWLSEWMTAKEILLWGIADVREFSTPRDGSGEDFPFAISWAVPMDPDIMAGIQVGPNQTYADEYERVNRFINELSEELTAELLSRGARAMPLAASDRTDPVNIRGDFPHKTAATRAGLGWIGRNCQLVSRPFGPWIRLATVFTDLQLSPATPFEQGFCGRCQRCVEACPAAALKGGSWYPGMPREELLDAPVCDAWKKENYPHYHDGQNCGICSAVCPVGLKLMKKKAGRR